MRLAVLLAALALWVAPGQARAHGGDDHDAAAPQSQHVGPSCPGGEGGVCCCAKEIHAGPSGEPCAGPAWCWNIVVAVVAPHREGPGGKLLHHPDYSPRAPPASS